MDELRKKIDEIDARILKLLAKRLKFSAQIGKLKQKAGIEVKDEAREKAVLSLIEKLSEENNLDPTFVKNLYLEILKESRKIQSNEE